VSLQLHSSAAKTATLVEMNTVHELLIISFKIHFNIILSSAPRS
jgi:hypothetical protein